MPIIKIPTPLRPYASGERAIDLPAETVAEMLDVVVKKHPALKKHLFGEDGKLRPFVNLFLGEDNINQLNGLETTLSEQDIVMIIPSIAGGYD